MRPLLEFWGLTLEVLFNIYSYVEEYIPALKPHYFHVKTMFFKLAMPNQTHTSQYLF